MPPILGTALVVLACARAAGTPLAGRWEGFLDGRKAVALELTEGPVWTGNVVFYILRSDDGTREGEAAAALPIRHPHWDGETLSFTVEVGDRTVGFHMHAAGDGKAALTWLATGDLPELTIAVSAIR